ncbi:MAG: NirD/YgiW/YdeI family stress tolerance protein [Candidatus Omnitrophica bacterium]|nr:NirD/YgiW/YdeI family stress tolerance protein [Candidatus Omnitrophota bacterium]
MVNKSGRCPVRDRRKKEGMMRKFAVVMCLICALALSGSAAARSPYLAADDSWITLNGEVVTAGAASFELDYGNGLVTVEMDDWDWYGDAYGILPGDEVTVYGRVDDDLYETTSIEASSVYVDDLNTYFYASSADEESYIAPYPATVFVDADLQLTGKVTSVSGREFTLDTGRKKVQVDTSQMVYNPMDDKGFQKIETGDRVQVSGDLDAGLFQDQELVADTIITLQEDKTKNKQSAKLSY